MSSEKAQAIIRRGLACGVIFRQGGELRYYVASGGGYLVFGNTEDEAIARLMERHSGYTGEIETAIAAAESGGEAA